MEVFDLKSLDRKFKRLNSADDASSLPNTLTQKDVDIFTRILSCTSPDEVADISNDDLSALFEKIVPFSKLMNMENDFSEGHIEDRMRRAKGVCPRRII